jgi:hypothetical protein
MRFPLHVNPRRCWKAATHAGITLAPDVCMVMKHTLPSAFGWSQIDSTLRLHATARNHFRVTAWYREMPAIDYPDALAYDGRARAV